MITDWIRAHITEVAGLTASLPRITESGMAVVGVLASLLLTPVVILLRDLSRVLSALAG